MAYELRYTIIQALRDSTLLNVNIYEKDYTGITRSYEAIDINIESNASNDEPLPGIISSQLNISFLTNEEEDSFFPDLISFDIRKYFVKLYTTDINSPLWVGFLFNDYVKVPFTTGNTRVDIIAIDGLSFLDYTEFSYNQSLSINALERDIDIIAETLNVINYPEPINLITSCSYYADGMLDRSDDSDNEPFIQTYQYRRDFIGLNYYNALDNIIKSFGCRLFQSDGKWQILAINEMASDVRYYTEYSIYPTVSNYASGTFDKNITVEPYVNGNVHFINNSQNKIIRKGYPKIILKNTFKYANNYVHNGDFKGYYNSATPPTYIPKPYGWKLDTSGVSTYAILQVNNTISTNTVELLKPIGSGTYSSLEMLSGAPLANPYLYLPYMNNPGFQISFSYNIFFNKAKLFISITDPDTNVPYYYNSSGQWQSGSTYIDVIKVDGTEFTSYTNNVEISTKNSPSAVVIKGYVKLKFLVDGGTPFPLYEDIKVRNVVITQNYNSIKSLSVSRQVGTENTTIKEIEQPYGSYLNNYTVNNNIGNLVNEDGITYTNWYRYPDTTNIFEQLQMLMARQYSNLLNKNFGTMEADLGSFQTAKGLNYLDKSYSIEDSTLSSISYNNKKFIFNRGNISPQIDEVNSVQFIEITDIDNDSVETIIYNIDNK